MCNCNDNKIQDCKQQKKSSYFEGSERVYNLEKELKNINIDRIKSQENVISNTLAIQEFSLIINNRYKNLLDSYLDLLKIQEINNKQLSLQTVRINELERKVEQYECIKSAEKM